MEEIEGLSPIKPVFKEPQIEKPAKRKTFIINGLNLRDQPPASPQYKKWFLLIFLIVIVLGLVYGGIVVSRKALQSVRKTTPSPTPTLVLSLSPTPTPTPSISAKTTPSPTPKITPKPTSTPTLKATLTPTPGIDKKKLRIEILNGTGTQGLAAQVANYLKSKGYSQQIMVGNADKFDYKETMIKIKDSKKDYFSLLTDDLKEKYPVSKDAVSLDEKNEFDAIIVLGGS